MKAQGGTPKTQPELRMPPLKGGRHLVDYLFEIGPGMAGEIITFQEIEAWSRATGRDLSSWEASTLRRLSAAYLAELSAAEDRRRPPPNQAATKSRAKPTRDEVSDRIMAAFERLERQDAEMSGKPPPPRPARPPRPGRSRP